MADEIVRVITRDGGVMASAISGRALVERARRIHQTLPLATAALGRTLMAASMMGNQLKGERDSVTLQIKGGGPLGTVLCVSDSSGGVRGYVQNPHVELPLKGPSKLDVGRGIGTDGTITVIKDLGLKEPYIGSIALVSGEIAADVTAYYVESEQIPTACALGVLVDLDQSVLAAGGYLIQLLPGAEDSAAERIERGVSRAGAVTELFRRGMTGLEVLRLVLDGFELEVLETVPAAYHCPCTRDRVERALISMGRAELEDLIREQGQAELTCQFCDKVYKFSKTDLETILENI